jgi:hypothetical protein
MRRFVFPAFVAVVSTIVAPLIFAQPWGLGAAYLPMVLKAFPTNTPPNTSTATATAQAATPTRDPNSLHARISDRLHPAPAARPGLWRYPVPPFHGVAARSPQV